MLLKLLLFFLRCAFSWFCLGGRGGRDRDRQGFLRQVNGAAGLLGCGGEEVGEGGEELSKSLVSLLLYIVQTRKDRISDLATAKKGIRTSSLLRCGAIF